jgi:hypothetical protein
MNIANKELHEKIKTYLQECYFDIGATPSSSKFIIDEAHLAKLLTRIAVSAATLITTSLSLKQYAKEIFSNSRKPKR